METADLSFSRAQISRGEKDALFIGAGSLITGGLSLGHGPLSAQPSVLSFRWSSPSSCHESLWALSSRVVLMGPSSLTSGSVPSSSGLSGPNDLGVGLRGIEIPLRRETGKVRTGLGDFFCFVKK